MDEDIDGFFVFLAVLVAFCLSGIIIFQVAAHHGEQMLANKISAGTHTVEKHTFKDGSIEVRIVEVE